MRPVRVGPAWNRGIMAGVLFVDERTVIFRRRARGTASDRAILSSVDSGGQVDKLWAFSVPVVRAAGRRGAGAPPAEARIGKNRAAGRRGAGAPPAEARLQKKPPLSGSRRAARGSGARESARAWRIP